MVRAVGEGVYKGRHVPPSFPVFLAFPADTDCLCSSQPQFVLRLFPLISCRSITSHQPKKYRHFLLFPFIFLLLSNSRYLTIAIRVSLTLVIFLHSHLTLYCQRLSFFLLCLHLFPGASSRSHQIYINDVIARRLTSTPDFGEFTFDLSQLTPLLPSSSPYLDPTSPAYLHTDHHQIYHISSSALARRRLL